MSGPPSQSRQSIRLSRTWEPSDPHSMEKIPGLLERDGHQRHASTPGIEEEGVPVDPDVNGCGDSSFGHVRLR